MRAASKVMEARQAIGRLRDGCTVMIGGFGLAGCPLALVDALVASGLRNLTVISNNLGEPGRGPGLLLRTGQVRKAIGSFFTSNPEVAVAWQQGCLEVELWPQGTLVEAIRAAGAGLAAFYTPTAAGTDLAQALGLEVREFGGRPCVLVPALRADAALIRAWRADELGNLVYRKTARNFNPLMAAAADYVVAEVEEVVPVGELDPEQVVTPHLYVDALVLAPRRCRTAQEATPQAGMAPTAMPQSGAPSPEPAASQEDVRHRIARRAALELEPGQVVNLGVGIPTLVARYLDPSRGVFLHSENGLLGMGPPPPAGQEDPDLVNAAKQPVTILPGGCFFDSAAAFAMIRGGHVDVAVVGGLQVDQRGLLANWNLPGQTVLGVGGAMDLAAGARRVVVAMTHCTPDGRPKLVRQLSLPATSSRPVDTVITEWAVFRVREGCLWLEELHESMTLERLAALTEAEFRVSGPRRYRC